MTDDDPRTYTPRAPGRLFTIGWTAAVVLLVMVTAALVLARELRVRRDADRLEQDLAQGRRVLVTRPNALPPTRALTVPATIRGYVETPLFAKIPGYLRTINVDKGDLVTEGQVLAVLESPEIDQQVADARANYDLQQLTNKRNQELFRQGIVARQMADEAEGAMLRAKATFEQMQATQSYETIRAPYAGIVIARNVDPGALIPQVTTATNSAGTPILLLATISPVRVYAEVPQSSTPFIQPGDPAVITVTEYPGREFKGEVARRANALQPTTRTMLVEVDVPNEDAEHRLYGGMYAQVAFTVAMRGGVPQVPADALIFRDGKVYVPVVHDNRLTLSEVVLGYDDGRLVEVTSGVGADDLIALNVGQAVHDGELVQPIPAEQEKATQTAGSPTDKH
ncbi:MAG TPA: efflux RND transporter periplasmic adaptor subunit [Candidatus Binatia bacterium]|jgi:RND family efflux transporter MFP subunit